MRRVYSLIERAAPTEANVLILGENGTGKELVARELHAKSRRAGNVFVSVDLGAVAENLFESELFGHVKGAFTDARGDRIGRLQAADGGTLFLDEVGNLPLHLQPKLLTALEQRQVVPVGANKPVPIDVRVVAATNLPPERLADESLFRQDLLFRLNTVEIELPPLRERREDIPVLVDHYVALYAKKYAKPARELPAEVMAALVAYDWPGNVRALRHAAERAVILAGDGAFTFEDFSLSRSTAPRQPAISTPPPPRRRPQPRAGREADGRAGAEAPRLQHLARRPGARPDPRLALPPHGQAWALGAASSPASAGGRRCCSARIFLFVAALDVDGLGVARLLAAGLVPVGALRIVALHPAHQHGARPLPRGGAARRPVAELRPPRRRQRLHRDRRGARRGHQEPSRRAASPHRIEPLLRGGARRRAGAPADRRRRGPGRARQQGGAAAVRPPSGRQDRGLPRSMARPSPTALGEDAVGKPRLVPLMLDELPQTAMVSAASVHRLGGMVRVVAVQPIQGELNAVEIAAQSDLVRVLTHEIMNSMTPVTSLAQSAASLMAEVDKGDDPLVADARAAVETLARRADGVMHFVESYRQISRTPVVRRRHFEVLPWARELESLFRAGDGAAGRRPVARRRSGPADARRRSRT